MSARPDSNHPASPDAVGEDEGNNTPADGGSVKEVAGANGTADKAGTHQTDSEGASADQAMEQRSTEAHEAFSDFRRRLQDATTTLEAVMADRGLLAQLSKDEQARLHHAVGEVWDPDPVSRRRLVKARAAKRRAERAAKEERTFEATGIRSLRRKGGSSRANFNTPNVFPKARDNSADDQPDGQVGDASLHCYVCKRDYTKVHHFYDQLCRQCGDFNFAKRSELANLEGRVALVTGGRVKIGYQAGLKLLRCGARLIVSTRFPRDCAVRYSKEPDFQQWSERLEIYGLDLRHTPSVEAFCKALMDRHHRLDYIVNNACQTVRRPPAFYRHMMEGETAALESMPRELSALVQSYEELRGPRVETAAAIEQSAEQEHDGRFLELSETPRDDQFDEAVGLVAAPALSQVALLPEDQLSLDERAQGELFPPGAFDEDLQQIDLRATNSWRMLLADVPTVELLEVHLVNAVAPFLLNARLKPMLLASPDQDQHVVNVSAVEGQFYRTSKTTRHPHTNMAKASLNMMTRTSAADYHNHGIHMNSVDTGWVTDEDAEALAARKREQHRFHPPLDIVDGAARIVDPIISGANTGEHVWGQFLKDYTPTDW